MAALLAIVALGAHIWLRNDTWRFVAPEASALLLVFPAFYALGRPWSVGQVPGPVRPRWLALTAGLLAVGFLLDSTLLLALGWSSSLAIALTRCGIRTAHPDPRALFLLLVAGFPWLATDLSGLAWPLRTTAAATVGSILTGLGIEASADGPLVRLQGVVLSVDSSCSGMGALQACLLLAVFLQAMPESPRRSPLLIGAAFPLACLANLLRLLALAGVALVLGIPAAKGILHPITGLIALVVPALVLFSLLGPQIVARPKE